ncbi:MAG TPA: hypothetical protein VNJ09_04235 [Chthonomonadales bacterium]|nr:hypothetical protein [Chthonomonadales bacterium]
MDRASSAMPYDWERTGEQGFFLEGEDAEGIPLFTGSWDIPPLGFAIFFLVLGGIGIGVALFNAVTWAVVTHTPWWVPVVLLLWGGIYFAHGVWLIRLRNVLSGLSTFEEMAKLLSVDERRLRRMMEEDDICPQCIVNGNALYNPADFGDAATLLRPSAAPAETILLRPAMGEDVSADKLLRPTSLPLP